MLRYKRTCVLKVMNRGAVHNSGTYEQFEQVFNNLDNVLNELHKLYPKWAKVLNRL